MIYCIKTEIQKIVNLLDAASDEKDLRRFVTKKCIEVYNQSENKNTVITKKLELKQKF